MQRVVVTPCPRRAALRWSDTRSAATGIHSPATAFRDEASYVHGRPRGEGDAMVREPLVVLLLLIGGVASAAEVRPRVHGGGRQVTVDELPAGRFRTELTGLRPAAQATALAWLATGRFGDH